MLRALLVVVDPDTRELCRDLLQRHGLEVVVAADAPDACDELRRRDFDLVVSDGDVTGQDMRDLVRLAGPAAVGVIRGAPMRIDQLEAHGLAFCLTQPVRGERLLANVSATLNIAPVTEGQRATIERYFTCLERAEWDGLAATCTPDVLYHLPVEDPQFGRTIGGRASLREFAAQTFGEFKEPRFEIESVRALPGGASVRYRGSWLGPDGTRHSMPGAVLFVFEHELIRQIGVRIDVAALHQAA
jgi:CheY-like chemotaxis protein